MDSSVQFKVLGVAYSSFPTSPPKTMRKMSPEFFVYWTLNNFQEILLAEVQPPSRCRLNLPILEAHQFRTLMLTLHILFTSFRFM